MTVAIILCVITTFSNPFKRIAANNKFFEVIGSLGLLRFLVAGFVAFFLGELTFNIGGVLKYPAIIV